jgi:acyl-coenzyme A thioesterase PaaI-like protein
VRVVGARDGLVERARGLAGALTPWPGGAACPRAPRYAPAMNALQSLAARVGPARFLRWLRLYPPFLGAGVRVTHAEPDLSRVRVEMPLTAWNRNYVGTHFGGSLYSMCDPFLMIMLTTRLGPGYVVWDKAASIEFVRPGRGTVCATFALDAARLDEIRREADRGGKVLPRFEVAVLDAGGEPVARIEKVLYVRRRAAPVA